VFRKHGMPLRPFLRDDRLDGATKKRAIPTIARSDKADEEV